MPRMPLLSQWLSNNNGKLKKPILLTIVLTRRGLWLRLTCHRFFCHQSDPSFRLADTELNACDAVFCFYHKHPPFAKSMKIHQGKYNLHRQSSKDWGHSNKRPAHPNHLKIGCAEAKSVAPPNCKELGAATSKDVKESHKYIRLFAVVLQVFPPICLGHICFDSIL